MFANVGDVPRAVAARSSYRPERHLASATPKLTPATILLVMTKLYPDDNVWDTRGHQSLGQGLVITGSIVPRANVGVALAESRSGRTSSGCDGAMDVAYVGEHLCRFPTFYLLPALTSKSPLLRSK
jgi:hypothetical protein